MPKILDEAEGSIIAVGAIKQTAAEDVFQVAAVKFDVREEGFGIEFNRMVRPEGISLRGQTFPVALDRYTKFRRKLSLWVFEGDAFHLLMEQERIHYAKLRLEEWGFDPATVATDTLHTAVGADMKERVHDALYYARSLALFLSHVHNH